MEKRTYVNIRQGTRSTPRFSCGNTYPLVTRPFGMAAFALQTRGDEEKWFYSPDDRQTEGVRLTHIATPWLADYAHLAFLPQDGEASADARARSSGFRPEETVMSPDELAVEFLRDRCRMSLTPTERGASLELEFRKGKAPRLTLIPQQARLSARLDPEEGRLILVSRGPTPGTPPDFALYVVLEFDAPLWAAGCGAVAGDGGFTPGSVMEDSTSGYTVAFSRETRSVHIRLATSYISAEQAACTLRRELGGKSHAALVREAAEDWERRLGCVEWKAPDEEKLRCFYSCLYRLFLFPRKFYEIDENGAARHYSCTDGRVYPGVMYADNGFWDTFRTVYPFFALVIPEELGEMLTGFLQVYKESGWLPKWLCPGEWGLMPGTLIDAVLADAAVKGLLTSEQIETALAGMRRHAEAPSGSPTQGRHGMEDYLRLGYVPMDRYKEAANHTLDYVYGDFCIAQMAEAAGEPETAAAYRRRAENYRLLFDPREGFLRGRNADGGFPDGFDPLDWGDPYCEGGAWQNGFSVFHDFRGLAGLYGSREALRDKLRELFDTPPAYNVGSYGREIHEMTEMAAQDFGQCAISNQPSFHLPYLFTVLGFPEETAEKLPRLLEAFRAAPDGFPGDEDNGTMAGWYVFTCLGLYPVTPGTDQYVRGVPMAEEAVLHTPSGDVRICRQGKGPYVRRVLAQGRELSALYVTYEQLAGGIDLVFEMTEKREEADGPGRELPYSMSEASF